MATKYRKKPIDVEAVQLAAADEWFPDSWQKLVEFTGGLVKDVEKPEAEHHYFVFDYLHNTWVEFQRGDWIIKGTKGEFYPHERELFAENYVEVPDVNTPF